MSTNLRVTSHEATTVTTAQLEAVWKSFGQVASDGEFRRLSPREHGQLRRQLLRLEEFATSGKGYAQKASQLLDEIEIRIGRIARATTDSPEWNRSLQHRWNAYQYKPTMFPGASAHDLPAAAYLGRMDVAKAGTLQRSLTAQAGARILQG